jgi:hypothetical protein
LGCNDVENDYIVNEAMTIYEDVLDEYSLSFGQKELSYLLLKGMLTEDELASYIASGSANDGLKRYEIAVLLTKAMDGDRNLASSPALDYKDASDIPASAKKHVKFVTDNGLMSGMGEGMFSPNTNVTRAQAAVVLKKLQNNTSYQFHSGTVSEMNNVTGNIIINKCVNLRNIDLNSTTGNIKTEDVTSENINIKVTTGNTVLVNTVLAGNLDIKGITGNIKTEDVTCGNIGIKVTTGDAILVNTIAKGNLDMNGVTGDLIFDRFDANNINAKLTTGKVKGTILSSKFFVAKSTTGKINVPETREGGECRIKLTTGNVDIKYKE